MSDNYSNEATYTTVTAASPSLGYYKIESRKVSEPACILFARHIETKKSVVLKLLFEYQDSRYSLSTVGERQKCQLEALQWNRIFTPKVHIGLAHICSLDRDQSVIEIDEIIERPSLELLAPNTEYSLLMHQLPTSRRLDCILLAEKTQASLQRYIQLLTTYVANIHTNLAELSISKIEALKWGSLMHLHTKLLHNLEFLDRIMVSSKNEDYSSYYWVKDSLLQVFEKFKFQDYFEQRIKKQCIKRCHADLKAPNIWIAPLPSPDAQHKHWYDSEPGKYIYLLDAIDFNPMYSYIDILSDFAMLVIDIHTRTKSRELADKMMEEYLHLTNQEDEGSRLVLAYYLVEKAIIGAAVSILYDGLPDVGLDFLKVASMRMIDLEHQVKKQYNLPIIYQPTLSSTSLLKRSS